LDYLAGCVPNKEIIVDLSDQTIYATLNYCDMMREYLNSSLVSTGTSLHPTPTGTFSIWIKLRYDDMAGPGYYLKDVPFTMYFTEEGHGIHGAYWHNNFGNVMSHGCVNMPLDPVEELGGISEAEWFYNWAEVGTEVIVQE
jgi:lipoprotein-anchoring transpeptidase ErfK/SrfK